MRSVRYRYMNKVPTWRYRYFGVFPEVTPYSWLGSYHECKSPRIHLIQALGLTGMPADVPILMGTYNSVNGTRVHGMTTTAAASRYYQGIFGTFVRDPARGLQKSYGWPTYDPTRHTLIELFRNNTVSAALEDPTPYDEICKDPPPIPWQAVAADPPSC